MEKPKFNRVDIVLAWYTFLACTIVNDGWDYDWERSLVLMKKLRLGRLFPDFDSLSTNAQEIHDNLKAKYTLVMLACGGPDNG